MNRRMQTLSAVAVAAMFMLPLVASAQDKEETKDPIVAYRENVMKTLGAQAAAMGAVLQKKVPYDQNLALHLETISITAREALKAFETKQPGGSAKPEIWDNWKDFSDRLKALDTAASGLAKKVSAGAVPPQEIMAALTCKGCHDTYRTK